MRSALQVWPHSEFPRIPVGRMVLNRNPTNYFAEVEQLAFAPSHLIPGIEPSPDKMLQGRLFSYADTHRHRLGVNYQQLPVNCPFAARVRTYQRDGPATIVHQGGAPNYFPNSFSGPQEDAAAAEHREHVSGDVARHCAKDDDNFSQVTLFYRKVLNEEERDRLTSNVAASLKDAKAFIRERAVRAEALARARG